MNLRRCIRLLPILIACMVFAGGPLWSAQQNEIPRIIIDQDMSSDHDDVGDLAVLNALADLGECNILACIADAKNDGGTALCMNAINTYFGRPNIPCGRRPDSGGIGGYPGAIATYWPHPLYATLTDPPLAVNLYRQVLASQPDHSVSIVTTGYLNNLQALMQSGPDGYSPLSGMDLIRQKVKLLSCAGGQYPSGNEFNFRVEPAAANHVINNWPVAVMYVGFEIGGCIYSGGDLHTTGTDNPIAYTYHAPYPTWGQIAVYYAVRTAESQSLWNYNTYGHNNCDATGHNFWSTETDPTGAQEQGYMLAIERFPIQEAIDTLVMNSGAPKSKGTVSPPNQPSNMRATVVGGDRIDLQWTDNSWNETGFTIERKINGTYTQVGTVGASVTSYSDAGLSSTANVGYRVKADNAIGSSGYTTKTVYSGWTEFNFDNPTDLPLYTYYQYDDLLRSRPAPSTHVTVNDDSTHGQDLTINVMVSGGIGEAYVYFFYQDQNNWYRLNANRSASKFEKCIAGTTTQIGASGEAVNLEGGSMLQTWQITVSHMVQLQWFTNGKPKSVTPYDTMHQALNVSDTLSFSSGKIGLGGGACIPVWQSFSFDTTGGGTTTRGSSSAKGSP